VYSTTPVGCRQGTALFKAIGNNLAADGITRLLLHNPDNCSATVVSHFHLASMVHSIYNVPVGNLMEKVLLF